MAIPILAIDSKHLSHFVNQDSGVTAAQRMVYTTDAPPLQG